MTKQMFQTEKERELAQRNSRIMQDYDNLHRAEPSVTLNRICKVLATKYGVSAMTIYFVIKGRR